MIITHDVTKISHGNRKITHGVTKITHGNKKITHGVVSKFSR